MREIIEKVMSAEADAQQLVRVAQAESARILEQARQQARDHIEKASQQARKEAVQILAMAETEAVKEKDILLARAREEVNRSIQLDENKKQQVIAAALRCFCGKAS